MNIRIPEVSILAALLFPTAALAAPAGVDRSTGPARPRTVEDIYQGAKYRDPFRAVTAAASRSAASKAGFRIEDFSIHEVELKGIMKDSKGSSAILVDIATGASLVLRKGRVYTFKDKRIPGVTGRINVAQKTVILLTADKDVQTLRLGGDEDEPQGEQ